MPERLTDHELALVCGGDDVAGLIVGPAKADPRVAKALEGVGCIDKAREGLAAGYRRQRVGDQLGSTLPFGWGQSHIDALVKQTLDTSNDYFAIVKKCLEDK